MTFLPRIPLLFSFKPHKFEGHDSLTCSYSWDFAWVEIPVQTRCLKCFQVYILIRWVLNSIMVYYSEFFRIICSADATSQIILIWRMFLNCLYEACCLVNTLVNTCNLSHLLNCRIQLGSHSHDSPATVCINVIIICTVPPSVGFTQSITWYIVSCTWPSLNRLLAFWSKLKFFLVIYSHTCFAPGHRIPAKSLLQWSTALVTCNI